MISESIKQMKASTFMSFHHLKCYDLTSHTLLYLIYVVRIFSELTIIDYQNTTLDPALNYLQTIRNMTTISTSFIESDRMPIILCLTIVLQLLYFFCILSFGKTQKSILHRIKLQIRRILGLTVYTLRVLIVRVTIQATIKNYNRSQYFWMSFSFLALLLCVFIVIINQQLCTEITLIQSSKTWLSKTYHPFNSTSQILLMGAILFNQLFSIKQFGIIIFCNSIIITAFSLKLWVLITRKKFYFQQTQNIQIIGCILCFIFYILVIIGKFVDILQQNILLTLLVMSIFCQMAIANYRNFQNQMSLCFLNPSFQKGNPQNKVPQISLSQGQHLIYNIAELMKQYKRQKQSILLITLISQHIRTCENRECYHHQYYDQNKLKMIENDKFRAKFLFSFVQNIFFYYSQHFQIWALYHIYKLQIALNFPSIQSQLQRFKKTQEKLIISQQFTLFQIQTILCDFVQQKNSAISLVQVQKVIAEQENSRSIIQDIRQILTQTKNRWNALQAPVVHLNSVDSIIKSGSKFIRQLQYKYLQSISKYQYDLFTQQVFLFYFSSVVHSISQSKHIAKIISAKIRYLRLLKGNTKSNIQKIMYQDKSCVIELDISPQKIGVITNITSNCLSIFGFKKSDLVHQSVNKIIPKFLNVQHDKTLEKFVKTGSFSAFGQAMQSFAIKKSMCFKALVYLQISTSLNALKIFALIIKTSDLTNIMMDSKFCIKSYGERLYKIFDSTSINDQFMNYCLNYKTFPQELALKGCQRLKFLLVSNKKMAHQLKRLNLTWQNFLNKTREYLSTGQNIRIRQLTIYLCEVQISRIRFGQLWYYDIKFNGINQSYISSQKIQIKQLIKNNLNVISRRQNKNSLFQKLETMKNLDPQKNIQTICNLQDIQESCQGFFQEYDQDKMIEDKLQQGQNKDIGQSTSSMMNSESSYYLQKLLKIVKIKFLNKQKIRFLRLDVATCVIFLLISVILALLIVEFLIFDNSLTNFQSIMKSNQKVSYLLQILELLYNKAMIIYQYCVITPVYPGRCQQATTSAQFMHNYLFDQLTQQFNNLVDLKVNDLSNYFYLMDTIDFNYGKGSQQIQVFNFIQNSFYAIFQIRRQFATEMKNSHYSDQMLETLKNNWIGIKQLNQNIEKQYQKYSQNILDNIFVELLILSGLILLLSVFMIFIWQKLNAYMQNKHENILRLNQNIPIQYLEQIKVYTDEILTKVNKKIFKQEADCRQLPNVIENAFYRPKSQFFYSKSKIQYIFLALFFVLMGCTGFYSTISMTSVFKPFKNAQLKSNKLINSQREVLQNYFDLKQLFLFDNFDPNNLTQFNKLYNKMFQGEVKFNKATLEVLDIFSSSKSYQEDIKYLLSENICQLSSPYLSDWQNQQCKKISLNFYKYGVFPLINYNQRFALIAAINLKENPETAPLIFTEDMLYAIDLDQIYLVQVVKLIQNRINTQMDSFKIASEQSCIISSSFQLIMLLLFTCLWIINYKKMRNSYSDNYGHVLVFPLAVMKKSKVAIKVVQQNLQLTNY